MSEIGVSVFHPGLAEWRLPLLSCRTGAMEGGSLHGRGARLGAAGG